MVIMTEENQVIDPWQHIREFEEKQAAEFPDGVYYFKEGTQRPTTSTTSTELPSLLIRGINFASAMVRWTSSGFQMRSQAEIDERLAICQACDKFTGDVCSVCGCNCTSNGVINKLAMKGQSCPLGKWS